MLEVLMWINIKMDNCVRCFFLVDATILFIGILYDNTLNGKRCILTIMYPGHHMSVVCLQYYTWFIPGFCGITMAALLNVFTQFLSL